MEHISLAELNTQIAGALKENMKPSYWVLAEIGDLKINQKGHCYLELLEKEEGRVLAKMRGTIWAFTFRNLNAWFEKFTGKPLNPGMKILFNATIQYHSIYGLSLNIRDIDAQYTLGERARNRQQVIERLKEEGVFSMNLDLDLPTVPQRIAVVSSATAAGWGDFDNQIRKNPFGYRVQATLFQATVQGEEAADSITEALQQAFEKADQFDLVAIIRGGGASVDLDCFDTYQVASHICQFPLPVITGIGHQRDETVSDMVAHTNLSTPTSVAEFIISGIRSFDEHLQVASERISGILDRFTDKHHHMLQLLNRRLSRGYTLQLNRKDRTLESLLFGLTRNRELVTEREKSGLAIMATRLKRALGLAMERAHGSLEQHKTTLGYIDPKSVFARGYTLSLLDGVLLRDAKDPAIGATMRTIDAGKDIESRIQSVKKIKKHE